jgi:hypothetical protein
MRGSIMASRILSAAALCGALAGFGIAPASAGSESSYQRSCWRSSYGLQCRYEYESARSTTTTRCASNLYQSKCRTETITKDPSATRIMDGHGPR